MPDPSLLNLLHADWAVHATCCEEIVLRGLERSLSLSKQLDEEKGELCLRMLSA